MRNLVICLSVLGLSSVQAGDCYPQKYNRRVVEERIYAYPKQNIFYLVGPSVREAALQTQLQMALQGQQTPQSSIQEQLQELLGQQKEQQTASILEQKCVSCHNPEKTSGGLNFSLRLGISTKGQIMDAVTKSRMPPDSPLTEEERYSLSDELHSN